MERATHLGLAHHDPSVRWIDNPTPEVGDVVPRGSGGNQAHTVTLRAVRDGEAFWHDAEKTSGGSWLFDLPCEQAVVGYRFLVQDDAGDRWLTAAGEINWDPPDMWDFKLLPGRKTPRGCRAPFGTRSSRIDSHPVVGTTSRTTGQNGLPGTHRSARAAPP